MTKRNWKKRRDYRDKRALGSSIFFVYIDLSFLCYLTIFLFYSSSVSSFSSVLYRLWCAMRS